MKAKENVQSRAHYRIRYPVNESPVLQVGARSHLVLDLSERGMRISWNGDSELRELQEIEGKMSFRNRAIVHIKGKVVRIHSKSVAIEMSEGVPGSIIMAEQRFLLKKFRSQE